MAKVSIIVPVYNVEKYLRQCVDSLRTQTLSDIEIILVDDGSPDLCPELCEEYAKIDSRIKVVHKKNEGLGFACNSGIDVAFGDYVAFCDSDDYVDLPMYKTLYENAVQYNCDIVYSGLRSVTMDGKIQHSLSHIETFELHTGEKDIKRFLKNMISSAPNIKKERMIQVSAKTVLYSKKIIDKYNIRFVSERRLPSEDLIFNIDMLAHAQRICVLPNIFYNYRVNNASISRTIRLDKFHLYKNLYYALIERCCLLGIKEDIDIRIKRLIIGYTRSYICRIINSDCTIRQKRKTIHAICHDVIWQQIYENYPISQMYWTHWLFTMAMKMECNTLVFIIAKLYK